MGFIPNSQGDGPWELGVWKEVVEYQKPGDRLNPQTQPFPARSNGRA